MIYARAQTTVEAELMVPKRKRNHFKGGMCCSLERGSALAMALFTILVPQLSYSASGSASGSTSAMALSPASVMERVLSQHPEALAARARASAEERLVVSRAWLESPRVGFMHEPAMNSWSISQGVDFPLKYFQRHRSQNTESEIQRLRAEDKLTQLALLAGHKTWESSFRDPQRAPK